MAKLVWDAVTTYADGKPILTPLDVQYNVWWRSGAVGYNSVDFRSSGTTEELDLSFLPPNHYNLAVSAKLGTLESVRSIDLPFSNVLPASPVGLAII
jgi:hypothetical protein